MGLTGITVGAGVQARAEDGVTARARAGHLMDSAEAGALVPGQGAGPVQATVMVREAVALMVVDMELEVVRVVAEAVMVRGVVTIHRQFPSTVGKLTSCMS